MSNSGIPEFFRVPMAIAGFQARIAAQRSLQELTFNELLKTRDRFESSRAVLEPQMEELAFRLSHDDNVRQMFTDHATLKSLHEDLGATLILIAAASLERLQKATGESVFSKGDETYVPGVTFADAIRRLANQYKHLGDWVKNGSRFPKDEEALTLLVDYPLRSDAASEFLKRSGFTEYAQFESALLSCSEGIAPPHLLPDGRRGIAQVTLRVIPPDERH